MSRLPANPIVAGDGDPRHGTAGGYTNHRCRCELCRKAQAEAQRRQQADRAARLAVTPVVHGSPSTYGNWKCRCEACRAAYSDYCRGYNATGRYGGAAS